METLHTDAIPTSAHANRRDHTGMPIDAVVITDVRLSFNAIFRLVFLITLAQAMIGVAVLLVLVIADVI